MRFQFTIVAALLCFLLADVNQSEAQSNKSKPRPEISSSEKPDAKSATAENSQASNPALDQQATQETIKLLESWRELDPGEEVSAIHAYTITLRHGQYRADHQDYSRARNLGCRTLYKHRFWAVRIHTANILIDFPEEKEQAFSVFQEALEQSDPLARQYAARTLANLVKPSADDIWVSCWGTQGRLAYHPDLKDRAADLLLPLLEDKSNKVRLEAALGLIQIDAHLPAAKATRDALQKEIAAKQSGDKKSKQLAKDRSADIARWSNDLGSSKQDRVLAALVHLSTLEDRALPAVPAIKKLTEHSSWKIRHEAARTLLDLKVEADCAFKTLEEGLSHEEPRARRHAADSLGGLMRPAYKPASLKWLPPSEPMRPYGNRPDLEERAIAILTPARDDDSPEVRLAIAIALFKAGGNSKDARESWQALWNTAYPALTQGTQKPFLQKTGQEK